MKPIRSLIPIVLVASAVVASPAEAQPSRMVSYGDLDLSSPAGQAALDRRIATAIRQVCGWAFPRDLQSTHEVQRCREQTLADVQAQRNDAFAQATNSRIQLSSR